jgi:hypothetical protein
MYSDHLENWLNYLSRQLQDRYGVEKRQAQKAVENWLVSLGHSALGQQSHRRRQSNPRLRSRPAVAGS